MITELQIRSALKFASFFKSKLSEDAVNSKIIFEDRGEFVKIPYHITISAFIRGIVVYLRVNDYQQILEITENIKIPIEVPTKIGMAGILVGVDDLNVKAETMELNFILDASMGILGTYNLVKEGLKYLMDPNDNPIIKSVNEITRNQLFILIGLIKADTQVTNEEKIIFQQFMVQAGIPASDQQYLVDLLASDKKLEVNYSILKNSVNASGIIDILVDIAKSDQDVNASELWYILHACENLGVDAQFAIKELNANYPAVKYYLKGKSNETQGFLICPFNNGDAKAQFYTNNRIFIFDKFNKILAKGSYYYGGKKIVLEDGKTFESNIVFENLSKALL